MHALTSKIIKYIGQYNLIKKGERILIAVSGGPDSICLLNILCEIKELLNLKLIVVHFNHHLRGEESDEDQRFLEKVTSNLNIPLIVRHWKEGKGSRLQERARIWRYEELFFIKKDKGIDKIALGHTADDQAEEVLRRIIRGTGPRGLKGINSKRDNCIIRPLLGVWKEEILTYLNDRKIEFRIDSSNLKRTYLRNRIRLELIPFIEKNYNSRFKSALVNLAEAVSWEDDYIENISMDYLEKCIIKRTSDYFILNRRIFIEFHKAIKRRILRIAVSILQNKDIILSNENYLAMEGLIEQLKGDKVIAIQGGVYIRTLPELLIISKQKIEASIPSYEYKMKAPGEIFIKEVHLRLIIEYVNRRTHTDKGLLINMHALKWPLFIRNIRKGDKIIPYGRSTPIRLSRYFIKQKVPRPIRNLFPLIVSEGEIKCVAGLTITSGVEVKDEKKAICVRVETEDGIVLSSISDWLNLWLKSLENSS